MENAIFNDGTEIPCDMLVNGASAGCVFIRIFGLTYIEAAQLFSDESKTSEITFLGKTVTGYTNLELLVAEMGGIRARLSRPR